MSSFKSFIRGLMTKPPLVFPLVALFHLLCLLYAMWMARTVATATDLVQPLWVLACAICWVFLCDGRKWAVYGYVLLAVADVALYYGLHDPYQRFMFTSSMFPLDIIFCFFILFFYRRLTDAGA